MTDHYELFGVGSDATKDEIKAAYRSEVDGADPARRAELNRAWNVLSDPIQRRRYDEARASGAEEGDGGDGTAVVPTRRATGARRGGESTLIDGNGAASNGSGNGSGGGSGGGGSGGDGSGGDGSDDDDAPRRGPAPVQLPGGLVHAAAKPRSLAMLFDFSVLIVIFLLVQFAGAALIENRYPDQVDRIDALVKQVDRADTAKGNAEDAQDDAENALTDAKKDGSSADVQEAQDTADAAEAESTAADKRVDQLNDELIDARNELQPMYLLIQGIVLLFALLYCVPMSARTGQTLGKKLRKVRLVRVDGSPPGWGGSLIHYGVPIFLTLALLTPLGPLALILALGAVLWNLRDRNRQGVHDKLAKTFVVEA